MKNRATLLAEFDCWSAGDLCCQTLSAEARRAGRIRLQQKRRDRWSRSERRQNLRFLQRHHRNGEVSSVGRIVNDLYDGSWRKARTWLLSS